MNSSSSPAELAQARLETWPTLESRSARRLPELLSPAGDWECAKAAVENGADAIYFGLERFNARMRARNFTEADLAGLLEFLHRRGVKAYVAFNTLVFENELAEAEQYVRTIIAAGVDAAIVQDVGLCTLIRRLSPDFPIHASTQMTITSAAGVDFARELGCNLVVLARECSLKEIEKTQARKMNEELSETDLKTSVARQELLPLEVFVHGALCVAYSGQCLTSEALGGRSANRGECAQACRMPYELIADHKLVPLGDRKYLLSPQDLAGLKLLPELVRAGVASLKIEGRLKSPEYVANITRIYRHALDEIGSEMPSPHSALRSPDSAREPLHAPHSAFRTETAPDSALEYDMQMAFSRGLFTGWFQGTNNQALVHGRFGKKRGVYLGEIARIEPARVALKLVGPLKPGDGVVFDAGHPEEPEQGGRVYEMQPRGGETWLSFGHHDIDFRQVHVGDKLWKTNDPELDRRLRRSFETEAPKFLRPILMEVHGHANRPLTLIIRDELGHIVRFDSIMPLVKANKQPMTTERLRQQLGRLGGTPFRLEELKNLIEGEVLLPLSELNRLRREAIAELEAVRATPKPWTLNHTAFGNHDALLKASPVLSSADLGTPQLIVLVRNLLQLEAALQQGVELLYCDFENPKKYRDAVSLFRNSALRAPHSTPESVHNSALCTLHSASESVRNSVIRNLQSAIYVAPPRIFKMGEEWTLKQVRSCEADGYLIRNYDHLTFFAEDRCVGDFSFNVANRLTADYFRNKFDLERVTASYDLNFVQLEALLQGAPPEWFEVTIHQHMPMFHMEHCVFCAFLSDGTDYTNCGRPCDKHDLKLRDRVGAEHPVKADIGCRNTVFNALAQTGADYVSRLLELGVRHFRIEFLNETPAQVSQTISRYRQLLRGEITGQQLWRELKLLNQLGVTRGQMAGT